MTKMNTILGAGGPIGDGLPCKILAANRPFRVQPAQPEPIAGGTLFPQTLPMRTRPSSSRRLDRGVPAAGLKYDLEVWQELWPRIMANAIEACKRAEAKLIFFDNVYMYGKVAGLMTENTPYAPCSKKEDSRKDRNGLMDEVQAGRLSAMIARSAISTDPIPKTVCRTCWSLSLSRKGRKHPGWSMPQYLTR